MIILKDLIERLNKLYGINLTWDHSWKVYKHSISKSEYIEVSKGHYWTDDERNGKAFIGAGYQSSDRGSGKPCDSVDEVEEFFDRYLQRDNQISFF